MHPLHKERTHFAPQIPDVLTDLHSVSFSETESVQSKNEKIAQQFPHLHSNPKLRLEKKQTEGRSLIVGVVLSGGQAPGGHNVIAGLFDALQKIDTSSKLIGFTNGPSGILDESAVEITSQLLASYRNTGGFDLIGSGRTKIETEEQLKKALSCVERKKLDGLVVIGGDDSNTNAAVLGEYFAAHGCKTTVVGVPKTIDGDLQNEDVEISFGFDTATKTYSEMIGNIAKDALSAKKYFHFVKLMGRSASHIALECALATQPNLTFISEEVLAKKSSLSDVVKEVAHCVEQRAHMGKNYGIVLIPEGLIEFIPEMKELIASLNALLAEYSAEESVSKLEKSQKATFELLPEGIQKQLLLDRDPHGNVQVSHIATEALLIELTKKELEARNFDGAFSPVNHFFGYEGRAGYPSNFDATYCYSLGYVAALLLRDKKNGYMASLSGLTQPSASWKAVGISIPSLFTFEMRKGKEKAVIKKALVDLEGQPFARFSSQREKWMQEDAYNVPGPIQYFGPKEVTDTVPNIVRLKKT